jgi:hypothetical protein
MIIWVIISILFVCVLEALFYYDIELEFLWYDFWIGIYYDRDKKIIYINSLPCVVWKCTKEVE